jgi:hypothetical protein
LLIFEGKQKESYTVTRHYEAFRHPDKMALDSTVRRGTFCPSPMAGILHFSMPENISGIEECKIPAWAREKRFWHQQGACNFPE